MAERGGFEPPVPLLGVHTISSRAPSTARSPLRFGMSSTNARLQFSDVSRAFLGRLSYNLSEWAVRGKDELPEQRNPLPAGCSENSRDSDNCRYVGERSSFTSRPS